MLFSMALSPRPLTLRSTDHDADLAFLQGNDVRASPRDNPVRLAGFPGREGKFSN